MENLLNKNERYYEALDFFMMRNPVISFDNYKNIFCSGLSETEVVDKLIEMVNNPAVKEAIMVSSLSLNEAIDRLNSEKDVSKREQIISSILKYVIRMSARTTPYGLFSGVTIGEFGERAELKINNIALHKKRARPDMEWLYGVMRKIEEDENVINKLKIRANPLAAVNGTRLDMPYISNYGQIVKDVENSSLSASIRYTPPVKLIMEEAKEETSFSEVVNKIREKNPNVPEQVIKNFMNQLLKNEYIITNIRTPLINVDPFNYLVDKIKDIGEIKSLYEQLYEIQELLGKYNSLPMGEGIEVYKTIISKMKAIFESSNYLQVDLNINKEKVTLNKEVEKELIDVIEFLIRIGKDNGQAPHILSYKDEFMEVYGADREVSVIELLDEDKGIGAPTGYMKPYSTKRRNGRDRNDDDKKFKAYISRKIQECILRGDKEIVLKEEDLEAMGGRKLEKIPFHEMPKSLDTYVFLGSENIENLNNGDFRMYISPNPGITGAGRTFGRFVDILPKEINEKMATIDEEEKKIYGEDYLLAEIVELPQNGRTSNVTLNSNPREYEITIADNYSGEKKKIDISDLYIGIDKFSDKFYIRSKSLNKRIIATSGHMLNMLSGSNIYRFLREISQYDTIEVFERLYRNGLDHFAYIPRIVYKRTVIIPATWKISMDSLGLNKKSEIKEFEEKLGVWRDNYNPPRYLYQKDSDNRLLLNIDNPLHVKELFKIVKSKPNEDVILNELEYLDCNPVLRGEDGAYFSEFVVPLILNKDKYVQNKKKNLVLQTNYDYIKNKNKLTTLNSRRQKLLGDEWIYMKLYGNSKRLEEFLGFEMLEFCNNLKRKGLIEKFFFLRYADPDKHIRLRFKCPKIDGELIGILNNWFSHLKEEGLLTKVIFDTYFRETERYGGEELIELAEDVFHADSLVVLNLIRLKRSGELKLDTNFIAVANIIRMLEDLGFDYNTQKQLFESRFDKDKHRDEFKKDRKILMDIANSYNDWEKLKATEDGMKVYKLFEIRREALRKYGEKLQEVDQRKELWNEKVNILFSLTHMYCNRFIGANNVEELILHLIRHSLHSLEYLRKQEISKVES